MRFVVSGILMLVSSGYLSKSAEPNVSQEAVAPASGPSPDRGYCMMGRVLVEGTGEPVRDATVKVAVGGTSGDFAFCDYEFRSATSDGDGNFVVDIPRGTARAWFLQPPPGYWTSSSIAPATFTVSPTRRVQRQDYTVRRGRVWTFRLGRGGDKSPVHVGTVGHNLVPGEAPSFFDIKVDEAGFAKATLPEEAGRVTMLMQAGDLPGSEELVPLEWETGFRPDAIKSVDKPAEGGPLARFRLTDVAGRSATVSGSVEPLVADGRLVLRIAFPEPDANAFGALSGTVVDERGLPIAGAAVALIIREGKVTAFDEHRAYTDSQGRFLFRRVARRGTQGELRFGVVAKKPGSGGGTSLPNFVQLAADDTARVIEPIRLTPGVAISGTVVDHEGQAVECAWVEIQNFLDGQLVTTDSRGRFTLRDVTTRGIVPIVVQASGLSQQQRYVADGGSDPMMIRLPRPQVAGTKPGVIPTPSTPAGPAKQGQPAPPWQIAGWTDGKNRSLADYRGKVVFLDFWGIWCGPCVRELPALESLKQKYESKGVVFLGIHSPGDGVAQVRKFLALKGVTFPSGIDEGALNTYGTTVQRYGVTGFPTSILIDRDGVIALSSGDRSFRKQLGAILEEHRLKWETMPLEQFGPMVEILLDREIEKLVGHR
jgi:thiol-disulfide isomerase/thioredoxin